MLFFFNDSANTEIYTLSLHDALPISLGEHMDRPRIFLGSSGSQAKFLQALARGLGQSAEVLPWTTDREEHTSELQSRQYLVCRLLLEKKQKPPSAASKRHSSDCAPGR